MSIPSLREGQILSGALFDEPVRIETIRHENEEIWVLGLVGLSSSRFRKVHLHDSDIASLTILDSVFTYEGDGKLLRLGLQAYSLGIAYEFDPYFGLSISRVDPLPHQLEAVYDYLLKLPRVRFLLADDAGAGKTIMAGLLLRELQLRGLADQILIVCPANLTFQWQRELKEKFNETFIVLKGGDIKEQYGVNQWLEQKKVITSLDLAKRTNILPGLRQVHWDLVIVDEAHRMSWTPPSKKTARYALGELLRDTTDHILLMTATPHKGNPENFSLFLQLLDHDVYADVRSIQAAMERRFAPFYLRRTKEAMVFFPERQPDGTWVARKIFTKRITVTADFKIDGDEDRLYNEITRFVKRQSVKAANQGDNPRARAIGFLMALYQRRLASSIHAVRCSLENRARRLELGLKKAIELTQVASPDLPEPEELEEMEEGERQRLEELLDAVTLAENADQVRDEIAELLGLAEQAKNVEGRNIEAKLFKLKSLLQEQGFFENPNQRLLLFTEFKDTLDYLVSNLKSWGFKTGIIHGGMKSGSRDEPGTRLHAEQQFWDGESQILVATEAAGEGINLQVCNILFNYDIPWNPNRLEQRMGRIHRYGQKKDCLIFNFVATNTIEGSVLQRLLDRLKEIRDALDDDAVFNVIGEILPSAHVERILRDYYAGRLGAADLEDRILQNVDEGRFRAICQNALEGLASKNLNLEMLVERRARAQERRVVPETIARFIRDAADTVPMRIKTIENMPHAFEPGKTPNILRRYEHEKDWKLPALANKYPKCSTDRETAESNNLEWVTPGHPLFEAIRRHSYAQAREDLGKGACFYSLQHESPARMDIYRACIVDGLGDVIHERLFALEIAPDKEPIVQELNVIGNFAPGTAPADISEITALPEPSEWLQNHILQPFIGQVRKERIADLERVAQHIEISLTELIQRADDEIGRASEEINRGTMGSEGRLAQAENKHAELLARREKRRRELQQQKSLTLQSVERMASVLILPHPERGAPELRRMRSNPETEGMAMRTVMEHERSAGRQVFDVHEQNLGYDVTSLDISSGELRLIEVKGLSEPTGMILLTPNERRVAEDRRDCYWLYIVTNCSTKPTLREPIKDPARFEWHEVTKVAHYYLAVDAMTVPKIITDTE